MKMHSRGYGYWCSTLAPESMGLSVSGKLISDLAQVCFTMFDLCELPYEILLISMFVSGFGFSMF